MTMSILSDAAPVLASGGWATLQAALHELPEVAEWIREALASASSDDPIAPQLRQILPERSESAAAAEEIREILADEGKGS